MSNPLTDIAEGEPLALVRGDTWAWKRSDLGSDYPPAGWALSYAARREGSTADEFVITAAESGSDYLVTVDAATTADYAAGIWNWSAHMTRSSDGARVTIGRGQWTIAANLAADDVDTRTYARRTLDAIEAVIEGRASKSDQSYSIAGRSLSRIPLGELLAFRDKFRREVRAEMEAETRSKSGSVGRTMAVRFQP